jgi:hypothetical protein
MLMKVIKLKKVNCDSKSNALIPLKYKAEGHKSNKLKIVLKDIGVGLTPHLDDLKGNYVKILERKLFLFSQRTKVYTNVGSFLGKDYSAYEVSTRGIARRKDAACNLKAPPNEDEYAVVGLFDPISNKYYNEYMHRLACYTFKKKTTAIAGA